MSDGYKLRCCISWNQSDGLNALIERLTNDGMSVMVIAEPQETFIKMYVKG